MEKNLINVKISLLLMLGLMLLPTPISAEDEHGFLIGTVTLSQPATVNGVDVVVVVNTLNNSSGGGSSSNSGRNLSWEIAEQPEATSLILNGKVAKTITVPEGQTSANYSFSYEELDAIHNKLNSIKVAAYAKNGYGISPWVNKNLFNLGYADNVTCDILLEYQPFYRINGKVQVTELCISDEAFTLYAESSGFISTTKVTVPAGEKEALYTLNVISEQEYTMKLFSNPYNSFYNDAVRGTRYSVTNTDVDDVDFIISPAFQAVHGIIKLPDAYPCMPYDQDYTVRLSSNSHWIGQDIVTIKKDEREAEFIIPNRANADKAIISWGLGWEATDFYSNGTIITRNVIYPDDSRQWLDFSDLPDDIEIIPMLWDDKLISINCYYDTFDKYDETTDIYSGTETRISEVTVTHSVPLPQTAYLCAYTTQGELLGVVPLERGTIYADKFSKPESIAAFKAFLWDDVLNPVWQLSTVDVTPPH